MTACAFHPYAPDVFVVLEYDILAGITAVHHVEGQDAARDMVQGSEDGPQFTLKPGTGLVALQVPAWAHRFEPDRGSAGEWGKTAPFIVGGAQVPAHDPQGIYGPAFNASAPAQAASEPDAAATENCNRLAWLLGELTHRNGQAVRRLASGLFQVADFTGRLVTIVARSATAAVHEFVQAHVCNLDTPLPQSTAWRSVGCPTRAAWLELVTMARETADLIGVGPTHAACDVAHAHGREFGTPEMQSTVDALLALWPVADWL